MPGPDRQPMNLSHKHRKTLEDVFARPTRPDIRWSRVEALVVALGGTVEQRAGSRVVLKLSGGTGTVRAVIHSPHPSPDATRPSVRALADFFTAAGVDPLDR